MVPLEWNCDRQYKGPVRWRIRRACPWCLFSVAFENHWTSDAWRNKPNFIGHSHARSGQQPWTGQLILLTVPGCQLVTRHYPGCIRELTSRLAARWCVLQALWHRPSAHEGICTRWRVGTGHIRPFLFVAILPVKRAGGFIRHGLWTKKHLL